MKKRIIIQNTARRKFTFEVERVRDRFALTRLDFTKFFTGRDRIGESGNLEDAISLAKSSIDGVIHCIDIKDL